MAEQITTLEELLAEYNIQLMDLEYILNFMKKENISPQLAMRRVKLFEKLQEKMSQVQSDEKVQELTSELDHLSKIVEELQEEKDKLQEEKMQLDKAIEDSKLQQDLYDGEREELKMQMSALLDSVGVLEDEYSDDKSLKTEIQDYKKQIGLMTAACQTMKEKVKEFGLKYEPLQTLSYEIEKGLEIISKGKELPKNLVFDIPGEFLVSAQKAKVVKTKEPPSTDARKEETISPDQIRFVQPSKPPSPPSKTEASTPSTSPTVQPDKVSTTSSQPIIKENLFAEPEETSKAPTPDPAPEPKPEPDTESELKKKETPKKVDIGIKPVKDESAVSPKVEKILKLFISYVAQADSNENFKARVSAICDMDEAYIELGGLAMAQIYSYQTQSIKKKSEFERLINSWIDNGLPR